MLGKFCNYLKKKGLSENTIKVYKKTVEMFFGLYKEITQKNLYFFKGFLVDKYKPKTANLRIQAINKYLSFINKNELKLVAVKIQQKPFLENVISNADFIYFKGKLKEDNGMKLYFAVRFLAATGARISELIQIKVEHVQLGYIDLYSKGGKNRRIYIPAKLQEEALKWFEEISLKSGFIFLNKKKDRITSRGIAMALKKAAVRYKINVNVVYPHSFRHRFAKNFIEKYKDISLLADLMGHESIETTRIYLRRTSTEQKEIVDKIVIW